MGKMTTKGVDKKLIEREKVNDRWSFRTLNDSKQKCSYSLPQTTAMIFREHLLWRARIRRRAKELQSRWCNNDLSFSPLSILFSFFRFFLYPRPLRFFYDFISFFIFFYVVPFCCTISWILITVLSVCQQK